MHEITLFSAKEKCVVRVDVWAWQNLGVDFTSKTMLRPGDRVVVVRAGEDASVPPITGAGPGVS